MTMHVPNDPIPQPPRQAPAKSNGRSADPAGTALMTATSLGALRDELDQLRKRSLIEIAQQLREARSYGDDSNNDEYHAVREEQLVVEARIASLEQTLAGAIVVDPDDYGQGAAVIGSTVLIEDLASGAVSQYRLTSAHQSRGPDTITAASPMGQALIGATPGAIVAVDLPSGRSKSVRLAEVKPEGRASPQQQAAG
jgi:transcription elongation factor GreA